MGMEDHPDRFGRRMLSARYGMTGQSIGLKKGDRKRVHNDGHGIGYSISQRQI